jgi:hypothetical protein
LGHIRSNAVAYLALFVALGGTAVASSIKLSANSVGTAQLKNGAVTGKKVAKNSLTGVNINVSTLGTVPSATLAAHATDSENATNAVNAQSAANAQNATNAQNAVNAQNATNASELGGLSASGFQSRVIGTCSSDGAIASIAAAGTVGCHSTNVTQMLGGVESIGPTGVSHYLAGEGLTPSPAPTTESDGLGAPAVAGTAGNLDVGIFAMQPFQITFTLDVNDGSTALTCKIPAGGTTCQDSTDTASVPAGALVDLAAQGGFNPTTQVVFGWTDTTSG